MWPGLWLHCFIAVVLWFLFSASPQHEQTCPPEWCRFPADHEVHTYGAQTSSVTPGIALSSAWSEQIQERICAGSDPDCFTSPRRICCVSITNQPGVFISNWRSVSISNRWGASISNEPNVSISNRWGASIRNGWSVSISNEPGVSTSNKPQVSVSNQSSVSHPRDRHFRDITDRAGEPWRHHSEGIWHLGARSQHHYVRGGDFSSWVRVCTRFAGWGGKTSRGDSR